MHKHFHQNKKLSRKRKITIRCQRQVNKQIVHVRIVIGLLIIELLSFYSIDPYPSFILYIYMYSLLYINQFLLRVSISLHILYIIDINNNHLHQDGETNGSQYSFHVYNSLKCRTRPHFWESPRGHQYSRGVYQNLYPALTLSLLPSMHKPQAYTIGSAIPYSCSGIQ